MSPLWPHQTRAIADVLAELAQCPAILLTSPTGMGKSRIVCEAVERLVEQGWYAVLYTNRRMLVDQLRGVLDDHGILYGVRAAEYDDDDQGEISAPVQISSLQTEQSRVLKRKRWDIHGRGHKCLVVVDEAHCNDGPEARKLFAMHEEAGHVRLGVSATPLGLGETYRKLIVAGTVSEGRACGALVMAHHFGPDEPDMRAFKKLREGEDLTEKQNRKAMMTPTLFGRVWEWFEKLNPERRPTILFAPGVQESIWFAEQFTAKGVTAAHIDGQDVWTNGKLQSNTASLRRQVLKGSEDGSIKVLCNRFVLREGVDCPWLCHGIFATVFGALQSYLQSGGRLLRSHHSLNPVTIQDHGGNWHRHGSLNCDRQWHLDWTNTSAYGLRAERLREKKEREPWRCPECSRINQGFRCVCGYEPPRDQKKSRPVVTTDGALKELSGDIFRPRRVYTQPNGEKLWERMYFRSCTDKGDRSFAAAAALFAYENNWGWPQKDWPFMPLDPFDFYRKCKDVPRDRLIQKQPTFQTQGV